MKRSIAKLRVEYGNTPLLEESLYHDPFVQFEKWFSEALEADVFEPNGMVLATISSSGRPATRTVLLKNVSERGFGFFTDYRSRKGEHLDLHPYGAVTFWWKEIFRQVNIEGDIVKASHSESETYFRTRPKNAQLAALASQQSTPLASRAELEESYAQFKKKFRGKEVPFPSYWGGYWLVPNRFEFWQGREGRLHDRMLYVKTPQGWIISRLSP